MSAHTPSNPPVDPTRPATAAAHHPHDLRTIRFRHVFPFVVVHLLCFAVIWTGWSWTAVGVALGLYLLRMFAITAFFHRYFSHRTFRTSRVVQFLAALIGASAAQRGALWWASQHREHHRHSDEDPDLHSPGLKGIFVSHVAWIFTDQGRATNWKAIPDWKKYPELVWLDKYHDVGYALLIVLLLAAGLLLERSAPGLGTGPWQLLIWGFAISTTALYHATFTVNSLAHLVGSRRFATKDDSRNNWFIALLTLGEGWHNNHHYHPGSVRQGFYWWEFDPTYWVLRVLSWVGIVWDLRPVPAAVYERARAGAAAGRRA
jgi:stearoyl-CoA desaturase (delta-9 desaturase)